MRLKLVLKRAKGAMVVSALDERSMSPRVGPMAEMAAEEVTSILWVTLM
jgi:hypothetical protein